MLVLPFMAPGSIDSITFYSLGRKALKAVNRSIAALYDNDSRVPEPLINSHIKDIQWHLGALAVDSPKPSPKVLRLFPHVNNSSWVALTTIPGVTSMGKEAFVAFRPAHIISSANLPKETKDMSPNMDPTSSVPITFHDLYGLATEEGDVFASQALATYFDIIVPPSSSCSVAEASMIKVPFPIGSMVAAVERHFDVCLTESLLPTSALVALGMYELAKTRYDFAAVCSNFAAQSKNEANMATAQLAAESSAAEAPLGAFSFELLPTTAFTPSMAAKAEAAAGVQDQMAAMHLGTVKRPSSEAEESPSKRLASEGGSSPSSSDPSKVGSPAVAACSAPKP